MITHIVEVKVKNARSEKFYDFMINPNDQQYKTWWPQEHLQFHITKPGDENHLGDHVYFDEYLGKKRRTSFHAVVVTANRPIKIVWQMKMIGIRLPFFVNFELKDEPDYLTVRHELKMGYSGIGKIFDLFIRLVFNKKYKEDLENHCNIEWPKLAELLS